jgi:hypothetical protein
LPAGALLEVSAATADDDGEVSVGSLRDDGKHKVSRISEWDLQQQVAAAAAALHRFWGERRKLLAV